MSPTQPLHGKFKNVLKTFLLRSCNEIKSNKMMKFNFNTSYITGGSKLNSRSSEQSSKLVECLVLKVIYFS